MTKPRTAAQTKHSVTRRSQTPRVQASEATEARITDKELAFAEEYSLSWNKTQAAIRAGYSKKSARYIGYELLLKPHIQKLVRDIQRERAERLDLDAVWGRVRIPRFRAG